MEIIKDALKHWRVLPKMCVFLLLLLLIMIPVALMSDLTCKALNFFGLKNEGY